MLSKLLSADFTQKCLSAPESDSDAVSTLTQDTNMATVHDTPTPLLMEWAKAKLAHYSWKDALLSAVDVSITFCSRVYPWPRHSCFEVHRFKIHTLPGYI